MAGKETTMSLLKNKFIVIPIICSIIFAVLLFPSIVDRHGFVKSLYFTQLGVVVIWVMFFLLSWFINSIVEDEIKKRMANKNHR